MRPRVRIEKIGKEWAVVLRSGLIAYRSSCYAKVIGVNDYLEARVVEQEAETRRAQIEFKNAAQESIRGRGPAPHQSPSRKRKPTQHAAEKE